MEKEVINLIINGKPDVAYTILAILIAIWLFKEFRSRYIKDEDFETKQLYEIAIIFGQLEYSILQYLRYQDETTLSQLNEKISCCRTYLPRKLFKKLDSYCIDPNPDVLKLFLNELRTEISLINYEQSKKIKIFKSDIIKYFFSSIKSILIPIAMTTFTMIAFFSIFLFGFLVNAQSTWYQKLHLFAAGVNGLLVIILIYFSTELMIEKRFNYTWKNWLLLFGMIIVFFVLILIKYAVFSYIILVVLYIFFAFPRMIKKTES